MSLEFRYFRGPEADMVGLLRGIRTCSLCEQPGRCFSLDGGISCELTEEERQGKTGCTNCLKRDRFGFGHVTEAGYITEDGLMEYDEVEVKEPRVFVVADDGRTIVDGGPFIQPPHEHVPNQAVLELRRTPRFPTWQDTDWPVHHNDFMVYLGIWGPTNFERLTGANSGRSLYLEMVNAAWHSLWPEDKAPAFGENIIAFECPHCLAKIGIPDFD